MLKYVNILRDSSKKRVTLTHKVYKMFYFRNRIKTRGAKYILARRYYKETGKLGERTKKIGLSRDKCKELILDHIKKNKRGSMAEFMQIFPELSRADISNLRSELKKDNKIQKSGGSTNTAYWILVE